MRLWVGSLLVLSLVQQVSGATPAKYKNAVARAKKDLASIGITTNRPIVVNTRLKSLGIHNGKRDVISINPKGQTRSDLVNTLAHEMKHGRDDAMVDGALKELKQLRSDLRKITRYGTKMYAAYKKARGANRAAIGQQLDQIHEDHTVRAQRIDYLNGLISSDRLETRANRAGAFAMGRLGRSIGSSHLFGKQKKEYAVQEHLQWANINGYVLGAKVALRRSPEFAALSKSQRKVAMQRIDAYLAGFTDMLAHQSAEWAKKKGDLSMNPRAQPLSARVEARRAQGYEKLTSDRELAVAGQQDAMNGLSPTARLSELLRSPSLVAKAKAKVVALFRR